MKKHVIAYLLLFITFGLLTGFFYVERKHVDFLRDGVKNVEEVLSLFEDE